MKTGLTIGQVAKQLGVSRDAIRIYEDQGLIEKPERGANGYRLYSEIAVAHVHFILRAKVMGFSLKEISELLVIRQVTSTACRQVKKQVEEKLTDIEKKIIELQKLQKALRQSTLACLTCEAQKKDQDCPLVDSWNDEVEEKSFICNFKKIY